MQIYLMQDAGMTDTFRLYMQAVAKRCCLMDKVEPRWNHYDLKHLYWVLDEEEFQKLFMPKYKTFCKEYAEWIETDRQLDENLIMALNTIVAISIISASWLLCEKLYNKDSM